jgi:hypothetical protein
VHNAIQYGVGANPCTDNALQVPSRSVRNARDGRSYLRDTVVDNSPIPDHPSLPNFAPQEDLALSPLSSSGGPQKFF